MNSTLEKGKFSIAQFIFFCFVFIFLAVWAPMARLFHYNSEYFTLSFFEAVIGALLLASILSLPLIIFPLILRLRYLSYLCISAFFISSVIMTFLIPVKLGPIEGGGQIALEYRKGALLFSVIALSFYLILGFFLKSKGDLQKKFTASVKNLNIFGLLYILVFTSIAFYSTDHKPLLTQTSNLPESNIKISNKKNIFIISFDQIQGSFFNGYVSENKELFDIFSGFTFYPDAATTYPNTNFSLASTLLGRISKNKSENSAYAYSSSDSILAVAENNGYKVYVYVGTSPKGIGNYDCFLCGQDTGNLNIIQMYELMRHGFNMAFGTDIALFGMNLLISKWWAVDLELADYIWKFDINKFQHIINNIDTQKENPNFFFMHFLFTHQPFTYNRDCSFKTIDQITSSQNLEGAKDTVACMINLLDKFFSKLKLKGVYDNSMIFVISDHGYERDINRLYYENDGDLFLTETSAAVGDIANIKPVGSYNPILLYKDFNSKGRLMFDLSPASLLDIAPTICDAIDGCEHSWEGFNLCNKLPDTRKRKFWQYFGGDGSKRRDSDGLDKLHDGLDKWWKINEFEGSIYPHLAFSLGLDKNKYQRFYEIGNSISFAEDGLSEVYCTTGWSGQEANHRWTDGSRAALPFKLTQLPAGDIVLRLRGCGYIARGQIDHQKVIVIANNQQVAQWAMRGEEWFEASIPDGLIGDDGLISIVFEISNPSAPAGFGHSTDKRKLGMAVKELVIEPAP